MIPIRKAIVVLLALALLAVFSLGAAGNAAATQNAPSWSSGNQWVYSSTSGSTTTTETFAVKGQASLTIGSTTYQVWHVTATTATSSGSSSISITLDEWFTTNGMKLAKVSGTIPLLGNVTATYDAPYPYAVFPLNPGNSWTGASQVTTQSSFGTSTANSAWNGTVMTEQSVTVPAGTFTAAVVWSRVGDSAPAVYYYSEQVGWAVRIDSYNNAGHYTGSMNLTSYAYSGYGLFGISNIVWIAILLLLLVVVVAAVVLLRRRRPPMPYPMPPPTPYQPPYQQPPQQGPPGGSSPPPPGP